MKLYCYEVLKIFKSKPLVALAVVLLLLNFAACLYDTGQYAQNVVPNKVLEPLYEEYAVSPLHIDAEYKNWIAEYAVYSEAIIKYNKYGEGEATILPQSSLISSDKFTDNDVYKKLYSDVNKSAVYKASLETVITDAKKTVMGYDASGVSESSYINLYQQKIINLYTDLKDNVFIGFENTRGWDIFFSSMYPVLFSFLSVIFFAGYLFTLEKSASIYPILHTSKKGRYSLSVAKLCAALTYILCLSLAFYLTEFILVYIKIGYGSIFNDIQVYETFTYCQYKLTVLDYLILSSLVKMLALVILCAAIIPLSVLLADYLTSCLLGTALLGASFGGYLASASHGHNIFHQINIITMGTATSPFSRYHAVNVLDKPCDLLIVSSIVLLILSAFGLIMTVFLFSRGYNGVIKFKIPLNISKLFTVPDVNKGGKKAHCITSLTYYELYKLFSNKTMILVVVCYILLEIAYFISLYSEPLSTNEEKKLDYISLLYGEVSDKKTEYITIEDARIQTALANEGYYDALYKNDSISIDEYKTHSNEYGYAKSKSKAFAEIKAYSEYLNGKSEEENVSGCYLYANGWELLFFNSADVFFAVFIIFMTCRAVGVEYKSDSSRGAFVQILRTTVKGREKLFKTKIRCVLTVITVMYVFVSAFKIMLLRSLYTLDGFSAPLFSLEALSAAPSGLTVGIYTVIHALIQLVLYCTLALSVIAVSFIIKNNSAVFVLSEICVFLPSVMSGLGLKFAEYFNFLALASVSEWFAVDVINVFSIIIFIVSDVILWKTASRKYCG